MASPEQHPIPSTSPVPCPTCNESALTFAAITRDMTILVCTQCGTSLTVPLARPPGDNAQR